MFTVRQWNLSCESIFITLAFNLVPGLVLAQ